MVESPVINTSPLIFLTKANQLELLQQVKMPLMASFIISKEK